MKKIPATLAIVLFLFFFAYAAAQSIPSLVMNYPGSNTAGTPWAGIRADSIAWLVRSTYEIDPRSKGNQVFRNPSLFSLMCEDVRTGRTRAFGTGTDSFTSMFMYDEVLTLTHKMLADSGKSCRIRIIEDLIGMKDTRKQYHRIVGIAPEMQDSYGIWKPLFWIYFQELNAQLARTPVSDKVAYTWLTVFDRRAYTSRLLYSADTLRYDDIVGYPGR